MIDEFKGRPEAQARGLSVIGTLGVLRDGQAGLMDARDDLRRLMQDTSFRITTKLEEEFLASFRGRTPKS